MEKYAERKANRYEVSKKFRLHSMVALQRPGAQLQRHVYCTGQGEAQHIDVGLPNQDSAGTPGVGNNV